MSFSKVDRALVCVTAGMVALSGVAAAQTRVPSVDRAATVVAHSTDISERAATLSFHLSDGETVAVSFSRGMATLNRREIARYDSGGELDLAWSRLLVHAPDVEPAEMLRLVQDWSLLNLGGTADEALGGVLASLRVQAPTPVEPRRPARPERMTVAEVDSNSPVNLSGLAAPEGLDALEGLAALEELAGLKRLEGLSGLDVEAIQRQIREQLDAASAAAAESAIAEVYAPVSGGRNVQAVVGRVAGDVVGLIAAFVAMCSLGFGLVFFAPRQLEIVSDTVRNSFWRSFFAGLFAQPLILPVFVLCMLGLAITVIGILVIPFAAIAFAAALLLGVLGGYLAVARSVGEAYLRERMSQGHAVGGWLSYKYVVYGLIALFVVWLPAVLFGWAPGVGRFLTVTAVLISWIVATAGFGATILSRAGIRDTFSRRFDHLLSDEYLYRTPRATPVTAARTHRDRSEP